MRFRANCFQAPFGYLLAPALPTDRGIGFLRAEEGTRTASAKAALAVLSDVAGAGGEHRLGYALEIHIRDKDDHLAPARAGALPQGTNLLQVQLPGQQFIDPSGRVVKRRVQAVDGDTAANQLQ